ncbi:MAG: hypothetical protein QNK36_11630 [Colwellia sp.]|nr:hypothetical protein [Colwellia sp.]
MGNVRYQEAACNAPSKLISLHDIYSIYVGLNKIDRQQNYRLLFEIIVDKNDSHIISKVVQFSMPTGDNHFQQ